MKSHLDSFLCFWLSVHLLWQFSIDDVPRAPWLNLEPTSSSNPRYSPTHLLLLKIHAGPIGRQLKIHNFFRQARIGSQFLAPLI